MYAKKSLGQNFLKSGSALRAIIVAGDIKPTDTILEIGPGKGALTAKILETGAKVIAVEKDRELIPYLEEKFASEVKSGQLTLIEGDILELSVKDIFNKAKIITLRSSTTFPTGTVHSLDILNTKSLNESCAQVPPRAHPLILSGDEIPKANSQKLVTNSYKLIANIPYYITGEIIRKYFEEKNQPERMVLLVQKEVAQRIVARDGKESILSIACKAYSTPRYVQTVKRDAFSPAPNVDSAIITFAHINKGLFKKTKVSETTFFEVMKLGFAHKRKKLGGNLKEISHTLNQEKFNQIKDKRPENLSVSDWIDLIKS